MRGLTDAVQAVDGDGLEGAPHHGVFLQHFVEMVDGQREEAAVGVGADASRATSFRQEADFCRKQEETEKMKKKTPCVTHISQPRNEEVVKISERIDAISFSSLVILAGADVLLFSLQKQKLNIKSCPQSSKTSHWVRPVLTPASPAGAPPSLA